MELYGGREGPSSIFKKGWQNEEFVFLVLVHPLLVNYLFFVNRLFTGRETSDDSTIRLVNNGKVHYFYHQAKIYSTMD